MKHTNSARGAGGQFAQSDGPKAKRVEVWLQPQALDLLDALCKQWGVGRGKAISHLICNGPVAPAAWVEVEAKPTPAPPAPAPAAPAPEPPAAAPTTSDRAAPLFAIGDRVRVTTGPEIHVVFTITEVIDAGDHWRYGREGSAPGAGISEDILQAAPTPSKEEIQSIFARIQEEGQQRWAAITAEAKRIGITAKQLEATLPLLKLSSANLPLSPEAVEAIHNELERQQRTGDAHQRVHAERLAAITRLATPNLAAAIADHCGSVELSDGKLAIDYLLRRLPDLGLKPYRKPCPGLWTQLDALLHVSVACKGDALRSVPARRALFWGVVLRLDHLDAELPTDSDRFLEWCQFTVHQEHAQRRDHHQAGKLFDLLSDRITTDRAREILGLPPAGTDLTRKAINDAYRDLARQHHPDHGGDATRFQRITEARERLLLALGG